MNPHEGQSSAPTAPTRADLEKIQLAQWLNHPQTRLALNYLRAQQLSQLRLAAKWAESPGVNDLTLRLQLAKAAALETVINKIEKGELGDTPETTKPL